MPVAIMIGHHPMYYFAAATTTQYGVDELDIASALLKEEVEMVKCETVDLEVPAHAEIILEGEIPPKTREQEGPFSEFQGLLSDGRWDESNREHQGGHHAPRCNLQKCSEWH